MIMEVAFLTFVGTYVSLNSGSYFRIKGETFPIVGTGQFVHNMRDPGVYTITTFRAGVDGASWDTALTFPDNNWPLAVAGAGMTLQQAQADPNVGLAYHRFGPHAGKVLLTRAFGNSHVVAGNIYPSAGWVPPP